MPSGNASSIGFIPISIANDVRLMNSSTTTRSADINASGSAVMNVAVTNIHLSTINIDNATPRSRSDFDVFHGQAGGGDDRDRSEVGSVRWLNLNGGISIPNILKEEKGTQMEIRLDLE